MFQKLLLAVTMTLALNLFLHDRLGTNTQTVSKSYLANILKISDNWQLTRPQLQIDKTQILPSSQNE